MNKFTVDHGATPPYRHREMRNRRGGNRRDRDDQSYSLKARELLDVKVGQGSATGAVSWAMTPSRLAERPQVRARGSARSLALAIRRLQAHLARSRPPR